MRTLHYRWLMALLLLVATSAFGTYYPRLYVVYLVSCEDVDAATCFFSTYPVTITAGDFVMFTNSPSVSIDFDFAPVIGPHNVVADDGSFRCAMGCDGEGGDGTPSASFWYFTRTFDTPGVVAYHDEVSGAAGTITVAPVSDANATAVEYQYPAWNFYFVTASPEEILALDGGAFGGAWKRTGQSFDVWTDPTAGAFPTCRFFSTTFAPKSSHFYTPYPAECASLQAGTAWQFEGIAFYVQLPDADGLCPAGSIPLYRLFNNGMGGAPNHRYTTSIAIFGQMLAAGWSYEGNGTTQVFACVPRSG
jgi:hypothetical protein